MHDCLTIHTLFLTQRNGMGMNTGIALDKLIDAGEFICGVIGRETQSKVARAMLAKRNA